MDPMRIVEAQAEQTASKILMLVMDGLGDLPRYGDGLTPLAAAHKPNLDRLARDGCCGRFDPVGPGITPGSGPGHLGLFGYDPSEYEIGRGVLSAVGIDFALQPGDVAARFNFCTVDAEGKVSDRRAGRIPTEENRRLVARLREIPPPKGVEVFVETEAEHRGALIVRGARLGHRLADTDPQRTGVPPLPVKALDAASRPTAAIVAAFVKAADKILRGEPRANGVLLRGFDSLPKIPSLTERFRLRPVCVATYPMYRGLARLVGMEMPPPPPALGEFPAAVRAAREGHDFLFVHVKYTDKAGEDGDFDRKCAVVEEVDALLPEILGDGFDVVIVSADHSTPVALKAHSWHPVPGLIWAPGRVFRDGVTAFSESECVGGGFGRMPLRFLLAEALAAAGKVAKFGA
ncbi:MAG: 2,3-bisphosphoglycerate-independent phosphoglycerate mutase [Thermoanaerobaculaceae bacterium]|nr:2,3-bisphosphoglycerate-independent phosphoglycerate mutase [Thermoanaerobaculaceae bacterium]TAM44093.1 MAG: 2,3-bisphosphoglycerate-independent phosphoglycerate mutase [Acidobacteriota bacterium]